MIYPIKF